MSKLGIGTGITPDDGNGDSLLEGAVKVNSNFNEIYSYFGDGTDLTSGSWQKVTSGINTTLNVGIGTTNPRFALEVGAVGASGTSLYVNGDARVTGILTVGSSSITLDGSTNTLKVGTGVTIYGNSGIISATDFYASGLQVGVITASTIIYEGATLYNAWQETSAGINTLSSVGIGTTNPTSALTVQSTGSASAGENDAHPFAIKQGTSDRTLWMGYDTNIGGVGEQGAYINAASTGISRPIYLSSRNQTQTPFVGIGTDRPTGTDGQMLQVGGGAYISGNVGIGSKDPTSKLTVQGNTSLETLTVSGVVTATSFVGDGSGLTGVVASGTGVVIKDDGSTVGTAGTINFGTNLSVSPISAGVVTVTASGGSIAGIDTVGTSYFNQLTVSGVSTFSDTVYVGSDFTITRGASTTTLNSSTAAGTLRVANSTFGGRLQLRGETVSIETSTGGDRILVGLSGAGVTAYYNGLKKFETIGAGVTVTGTTFTNQLNVSGVSTFGSASDLTISYFDSIDTNFIYSDEHDLFIGTKAETGGNVNYIALVGIHTGNDAYSSNTSSVSLRYGNSETKLQTIGTGVTVTGTTFTDQLSVSGVVTASSFSGSASGLTNIPSGQLTGALPAIDGSALIGVVASGTGVVIKDDGSTVGTAGTIDFGSNLSVSFGSGIATITASGGGGQTYWESTAAGIHTLSNVGVGTTNPTSALTVQGDVSVSGVTTFSNSINVERYNVGTAFSTFTATAGIAHTVDSFTISSTDFKTVEYTIHIERGSSIQAQKVLAMQNGTTAYSQEYAVMYDSNLLVSIEATVTSGEFRLLATPEPGVSGIVTYRFRREAMI